MKTLKLKDLDPLFMYYMDKIYWHSTDRELELWAKEIKKEEAANFEIKDGIEWLKQHREVLIGYNSSDPDKNDFIDHLLVNKSTEEIDSAIQDTRVYGLNATARYRCDVDMREWGLTLDKYQLYLTWAYDKLIEKGDCNFICK